MKILSLLLFGQIGLILCAQDCQVEQKIMDDYSGDAKLLALREIYADPDHEYADSINIPDDLVNQYLGLLSAVYSLDSEVHETIFDEYEIHVFPTVPYMEISALVDTGVKWINDYLKDSLVSGNPAFDSIMMEYDFRLHNYIHSSSWTSLRLRTTQYLNPYPIVDSLKKLEGFNSVDATDSWAGDGNDIEITFDNDTGFVDFSIGWGDCPAGCINRQYWKFKVYDCQATYLGTYGDNRTTIERIDRNSINLYPNPLDNFLYIKNEAKFNRIDIYHINGTKVRSIDPVPDQIDVSMLDPGAYIIVVHFQHEQKRLKFMKH